jgi:hypothetical protein
MEHLANTTTTGARLLAGADVTQAEPKSFFETLGRVGEFISRRAEPIGRARPR